MKSTKFRLGYEQNKSVKKQRLTILVLLTTLASLVTILLGIVLVSSNKHRRFQANTETRSVLSFHYLGLRLSLVEYDLLTDGESCTQMVRLHS